MGGRPAAPSREHPGMNGMSDPSSGPLVRLLRTKTGARAAGAKLAPYRFRTGTTMPNMPSVQIKSVPEDVHAELRRRAEKAGKSLQEYLLGRLVEEARQPSLDDLLDRAGRHKGGSVSFGFASEAVREDRDAR
jgi:antitoxin FitA